MKHRLVRIATHPLALTLVVLVMVYTLVGFTLVPWALERYAPRMVAERTGHTLAIGDVQANPYLLRLDARDIALRAPDGDAVATLGRLLVDLQVSSLFARAWTFKTVQLEQPELDVVVEEDGRLNLAELVPDDPSPEPQQPPSRTVPRLVVQHGSVTGGRLTFADRTVAQAPAITVAPIDVAVNDLATVPDREGRYVVTAALPDGATVEWRGDVSLRPLASSGEVRLDGLQARTLWPFVRERLALSQPAAVISAAGNYRVAYSQGDATFTIDDARIAATNVRVPLHEDAEPELTLQSLTAEGIHFDLAAQALTVARLAARNGDVSAAVDAQGNLDWARVTPPAPQRAAGQAEADATGDARTLADIDARSASATQARSTDASARPWKIAVNEALVEALSATYSDASRTTPLVVQGRLSRARATIDATLGGDATQVDVEQLQAALEAVSARAANADAPMLALDALRVEQGRADTGSRRVRADAVAVDGGKLLLERDPAGDIALLEAFRAAGADAAAEAAPHEDGSWSYALGELRIDDVLVTMRELSFEPPIEYVAVVSSASIANIDSRSEQPMRFELAARAQAGGTLKAEGEVAQDLSRAAVDVALEALALEPFQPVLGRYARLALQSGTASATAQVQYSSENGAPRVNATGALDVNGLRMDEEQSGDRFLSWKSLSARNARFSSAPARLAIEEVQVVEPGAKVVVSENRRVNIAQVMRDRTADAASARGGPTEAAGAPFAVDIARITLRGGTVDFADLSLVLPFSTTVRSFDGSVIGVSTDRAQRAEVKAAGIIANQGAARLSGSIRPFAPTQYTNLRAEFENVALPPFSPYSATFAGRKIESGRLWLELQYRIEDSQLLGEHDILLSNFELGERVEAPNALDLPLELAVALLTDAQGRINLTVPVRGDLGNPQFDYGQIIARAFGNVVRRIVSAPFRALGALVGGADTPAPNAVGFAPGQAELAAPEREKLDRIAQVLRERPKLELVVHPSHDPQFDAAALRAHAARRALAERLGRPLPPDEDPGLVAYGDARTQQALERMFIERNGADALARFVSEYTEVTGRRPERVNAALALFGGGSGDAHFYTALFERLVHTHPLPEDAVRELAARRAEHIERYLVSEAGLDAARVRTGTPQEAKEEAGHVAAELALDTLERG